MGRVNVDRFVADDVDPTMQDAAAGKNERVRSAAVQHGKLEIMIERGGRNRLRHRNTAIEQISKSQHAALLFVFPPGDG